VFLLPVGWSHSAVSKASDITAWRSAIALALVSLLFATDARRGSWLKIFFALAVDV
jgi:hypothetical protein